MHTGQAPNEAAGQRPRDLDSGDDDDSADVCIFSGTMTIIAQSPDRALEASDQPESGGESLHTMRQKYISSLRGEDADSSDDSSGTDTGSSTSDGGASFTMRRPDPYDGKADPLAFDEWKAKVETWAKVSGLSRKQEMGT